MRGATRSPRKYAARQSSFNPRARAGRDTLPACGDCASRCFNPRARAGRDIFFIFFSPREKSFNPRARAGRDGRDGCPRSGRLRVSIHAPVRGATKATINGKRYDSFQSTRPCGARPAHPGVIRHSKRPRVGNQNDPTPEIKKGC